MDLVRRPGRLCYRAAKHSLASTASLAHLRTAEQHLPQQQERRTQPGTIHRAAGRFHESGNASGVARRPFVVAWFARGPALPGDRNHLSDRKSTRLNSSHTVISYAVFCLKKKKKQ